jgi:hypothetical protein
MSRSRRKTPITGMSMSESEKDDKQRAHRRTRHAIKRSVQSAIRADGYEERPLTKLEHPRSGQATFAKDGKQWFGSRYPKLLRK